MKTKKEDICPNLDKKKLSTQQYLKDNLGNSIGLHWSFCNNVFFPFFLRNIINNSPLGQVQLDSFGVTLQRLWHSMCSRLSPDCRNEGMFCSFANCVRCAYWLKRIADMLSFLAVLNTHCACTIDVQAQQPFKATPGFSWRILQSANNTRLPWQTGQWWCSRWQSQQRPWGWRCWSSFRPPRIGICQNLLQLWIWGLQFCDVVPKDM